MDRKATHSKLSERVRKETRWIVNNPYYNTDLKEQLAILEQHEKDRQAWFAQLEQEHREGRHRFSIIGNCPTCRNYGYERKGNKDA
jgi:hypothetical protein